jgi:iron complex transport system permease protein
MTSHVEPRSRSFAPWAALAVGLVVLLAVQLSTGVVFIPPVEVFTALIGGTTDNIWARILLDFRLPRALTAVAAGASLGVAGILLQTVFRNPLADPWFLGLVHSARLGVAILVVLSGTAGATVLGGMDALNNVGLALAAGLGALGMTAMLMALSRRVSPVTLLLTGLMLGQAAEGLISVVLHFTNEAQGRAFASWNDGTFTTVTMNQWSVLAIIGLAGLAVAVVLAKSLNTLLLGDDYARTLGLAVTRTRAIAVATAAGLAGAVTAFCGPVAFLGILAPHLARAVFGVADHRTLVPASAITGAMLALLADVITHLPWSKHFLHMNAVLGLLGAPVVIFLLLRRQSLRRFDG